MIQPYNKPYLNVEEQIELLKSRGMEISDNERAAHYLSKIGYYRLSGYWYPFRKSKLAITPENKPYTHILEDFESGTKFSHAVELYIFDKKLRLLLLDALERIEIAMRVDIALTLGKRDKFAYRNPDELHGNFSIKKTKMTGDGTLITEHADWLRRQDELINRSKEDFIQHFKRKYSFPLPIWIAVELWDFGSLSKFLSGMKIADQEQISAKYGIPRRELLISWFHSMNYVRNICAHHSRIWNRSLDVQPKLPVKGEIGVFDDIVDDHYAKSRIYAVCTVISYLMKTLNPASRWCDRMKDHLHTFPTAPGIKVLQTGFPRGWETHALWNSDLEKGKT